MSGIVRSRGRKKSPTDSYLFFEPPQPNIGSDLQANEQMFKTLFQNCSDVHFRELSIPGCTTLLMIYVDGMINTEMTMTNVLKPLLYEGLPQGAGALDSVSQLFDQELFSILQTKKNSDVKEITEHVLKGNIAILAGGEDVALLAELVQFKSRAIGKVLYFKNPLRAEGG